MPVATGFITTQNGTTAPTDIGSIFSTGTTTPIYLQGLLTYNVSSNPASTISSTIYLSNITITLTQNATSFVATVPQTGLYLVTANLNQAINNIPYFFNANIPDVAQVYNLSYCSTNETSGSAIIPVTSSNTNKTMTFVCQPQSNASGGATITFQISYLSSL